MNEAKKDKKIKSKDKANHRWLKTRRALKRKILR